MALDALAPKGFIRNYCQYAAACTTAPLAYHIGVAASILAATCPIPYGVDYITPHYPNMFVMLVGRSGEDQKSTAISLGQSILFDAAPTLIGHHPGSAEGMIEALAKKPRQLLIYKEGGSLLASTQRGYMEKLKPILTDLADAVPQQRIKAKKKDQDDNVIVKNPRLSMLMGCSPPFLEAHTNNTDWNGGFLGRWLVLYAQRERTAPWPEKVTTGRAALVHALKVRAHATQSGWCLGRAPGHATQMWDEWFYSLQSRHIPELVTGVRSRAPTAAIRMALLYAWDLGHSHAGTPWYIDETLMAYGIAVAELYIRSVCGLSKILAAHPDARLRRQVLSAFSNGGALKLGDVIRITQLGKRKVGEVLDGLSEDGTLKRLVIPNGGSVYMRTEHD